MSLRHVDLERMRDAGDIDGLLAVTAGPDDKLRHSAAEMLGECGDASCIGPLEKMLCEGRFAYQRGIAARALGQLHAVAAVPSLIQTLDDSIYYTRGGAARALGQIGDARAVGPLIGRLKDEKEYVRWVAADALRHLGEAAVEPLLARVREDTGHGVELVALVLGKIGDSRAVPVLEGLVETHPENYVRQTAARALDAIQNKE